jgi:hypothetical protein
MASSSLDSLGYLLGLALGASGVAVYVVAPSGHLFVFTVDAERRRMQCCPRRLVHGDRVP